jgi:oligoendopeptidase F
MNYKGYNIAIHEFGHNVEQTISLYDVDYYTLNGVPNTAFTEALAFMFQSRDLMILDMEVDNPDKEHLNTLDKCWSLYEIMGVGIVDQRVWKWLYEHPEADAAQLKKAVIEISTKVWNDYYAPVFGQKDETLQGIYSHMIASPLYLSAYSFGQIIEFQLEEYITDKKFADEVYRVFKQGKLTPNQWMLEAVGQPLSVQPILNKTKKAIDALK